jgi:NADPH-dependent ferric siderophore reductase
MPHREIEQVECHGADRLADNSHDFNHRTLLIGGAAADDRIPLIAHALLDRFARGPFPERAQMNFPKILHNQSGGPHIERVRHQPKVRSLQVENIARLTPGMLRITFSGEDLSDFVSLGSDDHMKIFAPTHSGEIERGDYTPRRYDPKAQTLLIDFAVHDAGPATLWALHARPGDRLQIGGPRSSAIISSDIRRWLLIGDETALPAMGRRIEEANSGAHITSVAAVVGPQEHQVFDTCTDLATLWAYRPLCRQRSQRTALHH